MWLLKPCVPLNTNWAFCTKTISKAVLKASVGFIITEPSKPLGHKTINSLESHFIENRVRGPLEYLDHMWAPVPQAIDEGMHISTRAHIPWCVPDSWSSRVWCLQCGASVLLSSDPSLLFTLSSFGNWMLTLDPCTVELYDFFSSEYSEQNVRLKSHKTLYILTFSAKLPVLKHRGCWDMY